MFGDFDVPVEGEAVVWCGTGGGIEDLEFHSCGVGVVAEVIDFCAGDEGGGVGVVEEEVAVGAAWCFC